VYYLAKKHKTQSSKIKPVFAGRQIIPNKKNQKSKRVSYLLFENLVFI
jgi:hypothetical protein